MLAAGERCLDVALEERGEGFLVLPFGVLGRERLDPVDREEELVGERLLAPGRAVVVEGGDALVGRHDLGRSLFRDAFDEADDGRFRVRYVPRNLWRLRE